MKLSFVSIVCWCEISSVGGLKLYNFFHCAHPVDHVMHSVAPIFQRWKYITVCGCVCNVQCAMVNVNVKWRRTNNNDLPTWIDYQPMTTPIKNLIITKWLIMIMHHESWVFLISFIVWPFYSLFALRSEFVYWLELNTFYYYSTINVSNSYSNQFYLSSRRLYVKWRHN